MRRYANVCPTYELSGIKHIYCTQTHDSDNNNAENDNEAQLPLGQICQKSVTNSWNISHKYASYIFYNGIAFEKATSIFGSV